MQSKTMFYFSISMSSDAGLADRLMRWRVQYLLVRSMGWTYIHRPLRSTRSDPDDNIFDFLGFNSMWAEDGSADADIRAVHIVRVNWLRMGGLQFRSLADFQNYLAQQVRRQLQINRLRLLLPWQWGRAYREVRKGGGNKILVLMDGIPRKNWLFRYSLHRPLAFLERRGLWKPVKSANSNNLHLQQIVSEVAMEATSKNLRRDMQHAYDRARIHSPWPSAFEDGKIKILVNIRQGDFGVIRAPWGKFIIVDGSQPRVVSRINLDQRRFVLWPSEVLIFLRELVAHLEREQLSIITTSDGFRRTFDFIYKPWGLLSSLSENQLKALENIRSTYDEEQFSGFSEISRTYIGENSENLRHLVDGLMRSDIVISGIAGTLPRALLYLYRAQSTPLPLLISLLHPREFHYTSAQKKIKFSPMFSNSLFINIAEPDFELVTARIKEHAALVR